MPQKYDYNSFKTLQVLLTTFSASLDGLSTLCRSHETSRPWLQELEALWRHFDLLEEEADAGGCATYHATSSNQQPPPPSAHQQTKIRIECEQADGGNNTITNNDNGDEETSLLNLHIGDPCGDDDDESHFDGLRRIIDKRS